MAETSVAPPEVEYEPPVTLDVGEIQFIQACHPPLVAGEYKLEAKQNVVTLGMDASNDTDMFCISESYFVSAPRFRLRPDDIHSIHPAPNEEGQFNNTLPHVVFNRRTLPWERTLTGKAPELGKPQPPWMALLLLRESELQSYGVDIKVRARRLQELFTNSVEFENQSVVLPRIEPEQWENENLAAETCLTIDLPCVFFRQIAPRFDPNADPDMEELSLLAHVRQVNTGDKEILRVNDKGWFSVCIGNRLPTDNENHYAILVSLEGHATHIQREWEPPKDKDTIRLVALASWRFKSAGSNDFIKSIRELDAGDDLEGRLIIPDPEGSNEPATEPAIRSITRDILDRGYVALRHHMRQGTGSVSWYRGPLTPLRDMVAPGPKYRVNSADQCLRFDADLGMFDVSYAAAWQLGRLLALQNPGFVESLSRARRIARGREVSSKLLADLQASARSQEKGFLTFFSAKLSSGSENVSNHSNDTDLKQVFRWLGRLTLLYGVPLPFLAPHSKMAPEESIRVFSIDPAWIQHLLQGATSVSRQARQDAVVDSAMISLDIGDEGNNIARMAAETRAELASEHLEENANFETSEVSLHWPLTGFLLRSRIVNAWRGLEVMGYKSTEESDATHFVRLSSHCGDPSEQNSAATPNDFIEAANLTEAEKERGDYRPIKKATPLRIEQLSQETLIGIFNGWVDYLVIQQPQEGLHFGATVDKKDDIGITNYNKRGRNLFQFGKCGAFPGDPIIGSQDDGWIPVRLRDARDANSPNNHPYSLTAGEILDPARFILGLNDHRRISDYVKENIPGLSAELDGTELLNGLNKMINGPSIYKEDRFQDVALRDVTNNALQSTDHDSSNSRPGLNRLLLEDAFPNHLFRADGRALDIASLASDIKSKVTTERSCTLAPEEIIEPGAFVGKTLEDGRKISEFVRKNVQSTGDPLVDQLNKIINGENIYDEDRFTGVKLSPATKAELKTRTDATSPRLNRLLMEDAFPKHISRLEKFTSAEFAAQMIESPGRVVFIFKKELGR